MVMRVVFESLMYKKNNGKYFIKVGNKIFPKTIK